MFCPNCQSQKIHRVPRKGFFQSRIAPLFGYFPWRCKECNTFHQLRKRGMRRTQSQSQAETLPIL